jgi:hypothetical protein
MRRTWAIDDGVIVAPNGWTWRTRELMAARLDEIEQRVRLPAAWNGWRMQGGVLVPKHRRFQIRPETAERFGEWAKSGSAGGA